VRASLPGSGLGLTGVKLFEGETDLDATIVGLACLHQIRTLPLSAHASRPDADLAMIGGLGIFSCSQDLLRAHLKISPQAQ